MICIKPSDHISRRIAAKGAYEAEIINNVIRSMEAYPSAVFLDVGANIGMYALVIAAMRRKVIAVDADPNNLAYIKKSQETEQKTDNIELIYNAIRYVDHNMLLYCSIKIIMSISIS